MGTYRGSMSGQPVSRSAGQALFRNTGAAEIPAQGCETAEVRLTLTAALVLVLAVGCSGSHSSARTKSTPVIDPTAPPLRPADLPTTASPGSVGTFRCTKHPSTNLEIESCSARRVLALHRRVN